MQKKASTIVSRVVNVAILVVASLLTMVVASCNNQFLEEGAKKPDPQKDPVVAYYRLSTDSTHIEYVDTTGQVIKTGTLSGYGKLFAEPALYVDQIYPWQRAEKETLQRDVTTNEQEHKFNFNYGVNTIKSAIALVYYDDSRLIPRWPEDKVEVRAKSLTINEDPQNGLYYAETTVVYGLYYERAEEGRTKEIELDDVVQPLIAQENFKDEFLGIRVVRQSHRFNSGSWDPETEILTCTDTVFYTEQWKSGFKNESWVLVHPQNKIKVSESGNIVDDLSKVVGKSWVSNSANLNGYRITETWVSKSLRESKVEIEANGQTFNIVDSVHICRWDPDGGTVEAANKIRLNFAREGMPVDKCHGYKTVNLQQKEVKEVTLVKTWHTIFPSEATVAAAGDEVNIDHRDKAEFELLYNDNTKERDTTDYDVNHKYGITINEYIPLGAKGKTLNIDENGNVNYDGKVIMKLVFKGKTVKNLTYRGKDHTSKAADCEPTPKTAQFGENTVTVTHVHGSQKTTWSKAIKYNTVKDYRVVGNPIHLSWNPMGELELTCKNEVIVVEVMMDDSEGQTFKLPYTAYNNWSLVGIIGGEVEQEELDAVIGVPVAVDANGKVTILGSSMTIKHTMHADKVTKGSWSYQPGNCPANATYLTPLSANKGRVDVYHDGKKVGDFIVDLGFTIKEKPHTPDFPDEMLAMVADDAYVNGTNMATWEGCYFIGLFRDPATYNHKVRYGKVGTNVNTWKVVNVSNDYAQAVLSGKTMALIGTTVDGYYLGFCKWWNQGDWCKIAYFTLGHENNPERYLSDFNSTIRGENPNNYRMPLRGTWDKATGKITVQISDTQSQTFTYMGTEARN